MTRPSNAQIEQLAHSILARPIFRDQGESLLERGLDRIGGWIERAASRLVTAGGHGTIDIALSIAVVVLVLGVVTLLVVNVVRNRMPRVPTARPVPAAAPPGSADWLLRAAESARAGAWEEALRCHYRASVAHLSDGGYLVDVDSRTAGEQRAAVLRSAPGAYESFAELTQAFEGVWYAGAEAGPDDGSRSRQLYDSVTAAAPERR